MEKTLLYQPTQETKISASAMNAPKSLLSFFRWRTD